MRSRATLGQELRPDRDEGRRLARMGRDAGVARQANAAPMTSDTPIYIASVIKLCTATAVLLLQERGSLLDDPMVIPAAGSHRQTPQRPPQRTFTNCCQLCRFSCNRSFARPTAQALSNARRQANTRKRIACGRSAVAAGQGANTQTQHQVGSAIECLRAVECSTASKEKMTPHARRESREGITRYREVANRTRTILALARKPRSRT
jgi:Beta-lactamase